MFDCCRRYLGGIGASHAALLIIALGLAGCGSASHVSDTSNSAVPRARPQAIEPTAGEHATAFTPTDPVGDVHAHAPPLSEVRQELRLDATMPVAAPILAPCPVKILAIIPNWFAGQPLVYFELLNGPDAGKIQYVAEQITEIAPAGTILRQGQPIARYAASGTAIEYGWSTLNGVTLARATTGYEEGQVTPAGRSIRAWLNALGANAGPV